MIYATGEEARPGDIITSSVMGSNGRIRVSYIGTNGLGWEELDESAGGGGLNAASWSLIKRGLLPNPPQPTFRKTWEQTPERIAALRHLANDQANFFEVDSTGEETIKHRATVWAMLKD